MKKTFLYSFLALAVFGMAGVGTALAAEDGQRGPGKFRGSEARENRFHLVPDELREQLRSNFEHLSDEEREALKEERKASREEKRAAMEEFVGASREEVREVIQSGGTIGDILTEQGKTEADAEVFLTDRANDKVDDIVERHDLDTSQEQTIRDRVAEFVQNILSRWFPAT